MGSLLYFTLSFFILPAPLAQTQLFVLSSTNSEHCTIQNINSEAKLAGDIYILHYFRHHIRASLRDDERVLEMRAPSPVDRHKGPAVRCDLHDIRSHIHHRLEGERHALFHDEIIHFARNIVRYLRLLMEFVTDAVTDQIAHHRK